MNKHALVQSGMGLGLMAVSLGAQAQSFHSFDQPMMFFANVTGGTKYLAFMPSLIGRTNAAASPGVVMLELFTPSSGTTNSWGFNYDGGAVVANDGGAAVASVSFTNTDATAVLGDSKVFFIGYTGAISRDFSEAKAGLSSAVCSQTFTASIDTAGDLRFVVNAGAWNGAGGAANSATVAAGVSITFSVSGANSTTSSFATSAFNQVLSASIPTNAFSGFSISGLQTALGSTAATAYISNRNKCVPVYTGRVTTLGTDIQGNSLPYNRLW